MTSSRLVRGAKTRMFACVCLMCVLGALVYVFHGTQSRLSDVQKLANDCNHQQESLSAQLQVIFEYKLRLEKSLKKEKADHDSTRDACKAREKEERDSREKEKSESINKYEALVQQSKLQKSRLEDEKEELTKQMTILKDEKKREEVSVQGLKAELERTKAEKDESIENLKTDYLKLKDEIRKLNETNQMLKEKDVPCGEMLNRLEKENAQLRAENEELEKTAKKCSRETERKEVVPANVRVRALEAPKWIPGLNSSTTPIVNPEAIFSPELSSPRPSESQRKQDDQMAYPPKKSTQEADGGGLVGLVGQIPGPPGPVARQGNFAPLNPIIGNEERRGDAAVEEEDPRRDIPRRAHGEHYHGGDYDKEQPEEEEEDEGEQLDYVQNNDHQVRKEVEIRNAPGVMLHPK